MPEKSKISKQAYGKAKISELCEHYEKELEVAEEGKVTRVSPDIDEELVRGEWNSYR